jgi:AcrR family transcriptional regulator
MKEEQIILKARELFTKYGYKRVSMDEIAKEANVTKKTIYSYFKSKEDLLKYFIKEEIITMKKIIEKNESLNLPYFENVHNVIYQLLKHRKQDDFLKIIIEEADVFKNPIIIENLKEIDKEIQNYIKEKLNYAISQEYIEVEDVDITAFLIYKMYIALMLEWSNSNIDEQKIANNIIKILKDGLGRDDKKYEKK